MARGVFLVKADCVLAGLDVAFEAFRQVEPGVRVSWRASTTATACRAGDEIAEVVGHRARAARRRAHRAQFPAAAVRHRDARAPVRRRGRRPDHHPRHAQDDADAARAREVRGPRRRRDEPSRRPVRRDPDQGQPHPPCRRRARRGRPRARAHRPGLPIEIEAETLAQVDEALAAGAETILVDNMSDRPTSATPSRGRAAARRSRSPAASRSSGIPELAATGADFVSVGALTHSAPAIDISFEIEPA